MNPYTCNIMLLEMQLLSFTYALLLSLGFSIVGSTDAIAKENRMPCLANIRGDGEYADWSGRRWEFNGWEYRTIKGETTKFLVGERLFAAPINELENMTSSCAELPKWKIPEDPRF